MRSRRKIIDATLVLIERGGFGAVNVAAVAETASVSRQTVYSIFGSREELVSQTLTAVALDWLAEIRPAMASRTEASDFVVELVVAGIAADDDLRTFLHRWLLPPLTSIVAD